MESAPFKHLRDAFTLGKLWRTLFVRSCSLLPDVFHGSSIFSVLLATLTLENIAVAYPPNVTYGKEMSLTRFQYAVTQRQKEGEQQMELGKLYSKSILLSLFDTLATFSHDVFHAYCRLPSRLNGEIVSQAYEPSFFVLIRLILLNANVGENVNTVEDCLAYGVVEDLLPHCRTHTGTYLNKLLVQSLGRGGPSSAGLLFSEFSDALDHLSPTWAWAIVLETLLNSGLPVSVDMESLSAGGTVTQPLVEGPCTSFGVGSLSFKVLHQNRGALLQSAEETGRNELNTLVVLKHLSHLALALPDSSTRLCSLAAHADIRETHTIESSPIAILDEDEGEVTDLDPFGQEDEEGTNTDQVQEDVFTDFTHDFVHEDSGEVSAGVVGRLREGTGQSVSASAAPTSPAELYPQLKRDLSWYDPDAQRLFFSLLATLMWSVSPDAAFPNEESEVMTSSPGGVIQENEFVLLGCYYGSICRALEREITAVKRQSVLGQRLVLQHTLLTLCRTIPEYHLMASILLLKLRLAVYGTDSRGIFLTMAEEEALARVLYLNGVSVDGIVEWEKRVNLPEKLVANSAALLKSYLAERARLQDGRELTLLIGSILLYSMTLQVSTWKNGRTSSVMDFMSTTDVEYYLRYAHRHDYYTPQLLRGGRKGMDRQTADSGKGTLLSRIVFPSRQIGADSTGSNLSPLAANFYQTPSSVEDRVAGEVQKWALDEDETVMTLFRKYQ
ncbi:hypothetical protein ADEAN_000525800 [Angomonas deanei]|uniref:Uncharacterized protein n=1 Tax=Angomonas deanei TaxID=59799 RepID=A0A7G2CD70_9TRYP|nr:hypothetical protein ADEAN_000525800 [Angomonas deanei]